jgi:putative ABC transport system ATP-binding protein
MAIPVLEAIDIVKEYNMGSNSIRALDNVSLTINKGDFIAIVGKSGSGKSTLMHILGLLDSPTTGRLFLNGQDISQLPEKKLAKFRNSEIGFVFQAYNLLQRASSLENVVLPLKYSNVPQKLWKKKAEEMLNLVDLSERMHNKSNELSGGQKQRVAIARALVNEPSLILADEPTGNLDSNTGDAIVDLFKRLNEQGKTIVVVTHDDELAEKIGRQIVIKDGKIIK